MIELEAKIGEFSVEAAASLLGISDSRLINLIYKIEGTGYTFERTDSGRLALKEKDIMMILCFT